ncbi:MAG: hypothetical protein V3T58_07530 [Candidatus Hydrothermarchaeales archaeon]
MKQTPIEEIPEEWEVVMLSDKSVADLIMEQSPPSSTYNNKGIGLPFLQGKAEFGEIHPTPVSFCSEPVKIAEKRHNERFWNMISRRFNRYQEKEKNLLVYWFSIQRNNHIRAAEQRL